MLGIVQCSICGREVGRNMISFHEAKCPALPEIDAAVRRCIADPEHPGYALERSRYDAVTTTISAGALIKQFGSWIAACRHYGLLPSSARHSRHTGGRPPRDSKRLERLNAPLTDEECHACTRRGMVEDAATGNVHSPLRSVVL